MARRRFLFVASRQQSGYERFLATRPGQRLAVIKGQDASRWFDLYHAILRLSWPAFLGVVALVFVLTNLLFAGLYRLDVASIAHANPRSFWDLFLFSVQTLTSSNAQMAARSVYSNVVVSVEAFFGLLYIAMLTGLIFARFSRPLARVVFSNVAVILPYDGVPTLMFRVANQRGNEVFDAHMTVALARQHMSQEGIVMRRFEELELVRARSLLFALSWTVMHRIDTTSPLYGATRESLEQGQAQLMVLLSGRDDSLADTIYARHSYVPSAVLWGRRFVDVVGTGEDGRRIVDLSRFHDTEALGEPAAEAAERSQV
ncbi:MAG: ATP-sensitive inward rectifier potassium channel 10 [Alphaproteobacteria bacterium]|nr:ATP-sensitive inward rectifier potassium channel 10 [Alphaproteobacteria bacterium]